MGPLGRALLSGRAERGRGPAILPDTSRRGAPSTNPDTEKGAVAAKEKALIEGLNAVLKKMGYPVVALRPRRDWPGQGSGRKPGRPPGPGKGQPGRPSGSP
jgi:hypothetical protein